MNQFERKSKTSYDKKADTYEQSFDGKFTSKFKRVLFETMHINNDDFILDVACGNGRFLNMLSHKADIHGFGVDISENMIACAKKMNPEMHFQTAGCDKIPFENQSMNVVSVCAAFHHFPNIDAFAKEMYRILKPGGRIYIAEVYLPAVIRLICNPFVKFSKSGDVKFYSPKEIVDCLSNAGFYGEEVRIDGLVQIVAMRKD